MWLFLGSECLFFGSLIATYQVYRGQSLVGPYPHDVFNIPYTSVSAFVLLMSSLTMALAVNSMRLKNLPAARIWLIATALLGCIFIGGQVFEFTIFVEKGLSLGVNLFGTTFFVLTGFHGAHVTVGILILLSLVGASLLGKLGVDRATTVEIAGLYWHFVDIVWIVIFTVVYLMPY
jgi:heme/copper-type cytochrome/quinol oxidase subunit 3